MSDLKTKRRVAKTILTSEIRKLEDAIENEPGTKTIESCLKEMNVASDDLEVCHELYVAGLSDEDAQLPINSEYLDASISRTRACHFTLVIIQDLLPSSLLTLSIVTGSKSYCPFQIFPYFLIILTIVMKK